MNTLPEKHENPKGLHRRYYIEHADGRPVHDCAEYFILRLDNYGSDPKHVEACRKAVLVYAEEIKNHLPELSKELFEKYGEK